MRRSVVTGGAGFLGSHLCERLLAEDHEVVCLDNLDTGSLQNIEHIRDDRFHFRNVDLTEFVDVEGRVDYVFHLASPASPIDYLRLPLHTLKVGSYGTHNALGLAKFKRARLLLASTSEVYGDPLVHPQPETYWGNVNPLGPRGVYDEAKRYAEAMTMAYHRQQGVDTCIARIFATYGPRMRPNDGRAVPTFLRQAIEGKPLTVYGDGSQTRSFCYVDDLIDGLVRLALSDEHTPVNLGNPAELSLKELAAAIVRITGSRSEIVFSALPDRRPQSALPGHRQGRPAARLASDGDAGRRPAPSVGVRDEHREPLADGAQRGRARDDRAHGAGGAAPAGVTAAAMQRHEGPKEGRALPVDVIIVSYQSAAELAGCLAAVRVAREVARVIVVDNASTDGSAAAARAGGADVVIENDRNVGFARAVNIGLGESSADLVLLLNPDAVITDDALARLAECLAADPVAVMAGPMLLSPSGRTIAGARRFSTPVNRLLWHVPLPWRPSWSTPEYVARRHTSGTDRPLPVDYLWGAALLCRRSFLDAIGGLDERFFLYSEDEDLGRQARARGLRSILVRDAVVQHVGGASTADPAIAQARVERSNALLLEKWRGPAAAALFRAGIGPVLLLRAAVLRLAGRRCEAHLAWRTVRHLPRPAAAESASRWPGPARTR